MGGGGGIALPKVLQKNRSVAYHAIDPVFSLFRTDEENASFTDPLNLFGFEDHPGAVKKETPLATVETPAEDLDEKARNASQAEKERLKKRKGAAATIVTSGEGILTDPSLKKATLG